MQEAEIADVAQQIRAAGWSQGDLIGPEHAERLCNVRLDHLASGCSDTTFLVVLTQDCDLVRDLDVEPYVELLVLRELPREPQPSTRGQSSRNLHLRGERPGILNEPAGWFAASMHDRFRVPKDVLLDTAPSPAWRLPAAERDLLKRRMGRRYTRAPFPDRFEENLGSTSGRVKNLFRSNGAKLISTVFYPPQQP
jgi:hypothetical protein